MAYRLVDFSGDVAIEATAPDVAAALVDLGRALAHVLTDGSPLRLDVSRTVRVEAREGPGDLAVRFLNELVFLFDAEGFLVAGGTGSVSKKDGTHRLDAALVGDAFDAKRHHAGRGVKAATHHDVIAKATRGAARFRIVLDL